LTADIDNGSRYYTLAYTPTNTKQQGKERKIEIKAASGNYKLSYRRSYFEDTPKELKAAESASAKDPLRPLMDRGMPAFSELRYRETVKPAASQPAADAPRAGDNAALKAPVTRYTVNFALSTDGLTLVPGPDGVRHATIEVALVAYSQQGTPLNWEVRYFGLAIRPEQNAIAETSGIPFHFDLTCRRGMSTCVPASTKPRQARLELLRSRSHQSQPPVSDPSRSRESIQVSDNVYSVK